MYEGCCDCLCFLLLLKMVLLSHLYVCKLLHVCSREGRQHDAAGRRTYEMNLFHTNLKLPFVQTTAGNMEPDCSVRRLAPTRSFCYAIL